MQLDSISKGTSMGIAQKNQNKSNIHGDMCIRRNNMKLKDFIPK